MSYSNWFPRPRRNKCYVRLCSILKQEALNALPSSIVFRCSFVCTSVRKLSQLHLTIYFCVWFGASGDIFLLHSKVFSVSAFLFLSSIDCNIDIDIGKSANVKSNSKPPSNASIYQNLYQIKALFYLQQVSGLWIQLYRTFKIFAKKN